MNILIVGNTNARQKGPINFEPKHIQEIKKVVPKAKISITSDAGENKKLLAEAEIIIHTHGYNVPFEQASNLKWVHSGSAGVTDLALELRNTDVILTNSSGVHPIPISEWAAGIMLMFAKRFNRALRNQVSKRSWIRNYEDIAGFELYGKTIGIVGYGRIGAQIAKISKGIGMKVAALEHNKKISDRSVDRSYKNVSELLAVSDFVVDCLPLTPETKGYFDLKKFQKMSRSASGGKKTAYFLNIGRGGTVLERDLVRALKANIIAGAGLDVFEVEPLADSSPLWKLENVIITPHSSGWTPSYTDRVVDIFCANLKAYLNNRPMPTLVDKNRGY